MAMPRMWALFRSVDECLWLLPSIRYDRDRRRQYLPELREVSVRALDYRLLDARQPVGDFVMTPPMPTDETPSAGAEAMATRYFDSEFSSLAVCLDFYAREQAQ